MFTIWDTPVGQLRLRAYTEDSWKKKWETPTNQPIISHFQFPQWFICKKTDLLLLLKYMFVSENISLLFKTFWFLSLFFFFFFFWICKSSALSYFEIKKNPYLKKNWKLGACPLGASWSHDNSRIHLCLLSLIFF